MAARRALSTHRAWRPGWHGRSSRAVPRLKPWVYGCVNGCAAVNVVCFIVLYTDYSGFHGAVSHVARSGPGGMAARRAVSHVAHGDPGGMAARRAVSHVARGGPGDIAARGAVSHG
jgi:hypothetical protein